MIFVVTKKGRTTNFPPSLLPLLDPGSGMDKNHDGMIIPDPGAITYLSSAFDDVNCTVGSVFIIRYLLLMIL
jgi:hypothetical protein